MKLITEQIEDVKILTEERDGKKLLYIEGVFLQSELKNRNGRMYPFEVLSREVERYTEEYVKPKRALGELGHPDGPTINLDRVSHRIVSLHAEGHNFIGKAQILDTPMGNIAKSLLGEGVQLGVSSRGMGSIDKREDISIVRDDFFLTTAADIVADPSAPDAFVNGIMEGKEWIWDNGILKEAKVDKYRRYMDEATRHTMEERTLKVFEDFLRKL
ncbi:MAG: primosomal protein [Candidatus Nanopelagicaceae bacterium]